MSLYCNGKKGVCDHSEDCNVGCKYFDGSGTKDIVTNADRIRAMTDEEMAKHLLCIGWYCHLCAEHERLDNNPWLHGEKCDENCAIHCLEWLQKPAEED